MSKYVKNTSGATGTWVGQQIANNAFYELQTGESFLWSNDSTVLTDIGSGDLTVAKDNTGNTNITDVAKAINHLKDDTAPKDVDGAPLSRSKITKTGWHFQAHPVEFTTSKLAGLYNKDSAETDLGFATVKYYNSSDVELVAGTQAELDTNCVKTVMDWEPTYNIEVLGGEVFQGTTPTTDVRVWVCAIPDLTVAQGGSVPFVDGGLNLRYMGAGSVLSIDGKTPKLLPYDATYHTNKFRITLRHNAGTQNTLMMIFKLFKENA